MRVGAVDIGSNSTRLLVADVEEGRLVELERLLRITGLGRGVDASGRLGDEGMVRVLACLDEYRGVAAGLGAVRVLATATSAVRDAANGGEFLRAAGERTGFEMRLLSGADEALLTFRGVTAGREIRPGTLIVDIGGGSTELTLGGPDGVSWHDSLQLGCVRMTDRHLASDPPAPAELAACAADVRSIVTAAVPEGLPQDVAAVIGVAGTVTTAAALDLGLAGYDAERIHGHVVPRATVERELARLAVLPLAKRRAVRGLEPERAPVICGGLLILREILALLGADGVEASERDILHGVALAAAA